MLWSALARTLLAGTLALACLDLFPPAGAAPDGRRAGDGTFANALGGSYRLPGPEECRAVALIFTGPECPISNAYAPEIARLCREYAPRGIALCVVYATSLTPEAARKHARAFGFPCPALLDPRMRLVLRTGATVTPESAVLSPDGRLLYRGRIDDRYADYGVRREHATHTELRDALEAILADKPVPVSRTRALGCPIDLPARKTGKR